MNKAVIWLIVLVVVVGGIFLLTRGGGGDGGKSEGEGVAGMPTGFGQTTYEALSKQLAGLEDDFSRQQAIRAQYRFTMNGTGTVVAVSDEGGDTLLIEIDMDGDASNAEVFAEVPADRLLIDRPAEGDKIAFGGQITEVSYEDGVAVVDLFRTIVKAP
jgi:hypothetical protein